MIWSFSDWMTTSTKVYLPSSLVFVDESLDVVTDNGLSFGISCGVNKSKSVCDSALVLADISIMKQNCFQNFTKSQYHNKKKNTCFDWQSTRILRFYFKSWKPVENMILCWEILRKSKKRPLVKTIPLQKRKMKSL